MPLTTDLNVSPYFDDYDENNNYYRILFRPSTAIQARELNQLQSILQKQIERHGKHIFKEGTIVLGGEFDYENKVSYVKAPASSIQPAANSSVLDYYVGKQFTGAVSGVKASIKTYTYDDSDDTYVFFIGYDTATESYDTFDDGENIAFTDPTYNFTASSTSSTGFGSIFSVGQGVLFTKGFFAAFPAGKVVVSKYTTNPDATIGLTVSESIVNENIDETLNDNALGSPNENAPGAHRLKISTSLNVLGYDEGNDDPDFSLFLRVKNGQIQTTNERTQYARIYDEIAKRTYDESGDYYVKGFGVRTREHLDTGTNEGYLTLANGGDSNKISIEIDPGLAYVKGYEVNHLVTSHIVTDKGTSYEQENGQIINARTGGYVLVNEVVGTPTLDQGTIINLYNTAEQRITNGILNSTAPSGTQIGTARVKFVDYESGILGRPSAELKVYLYDIQMSSGVFSDTRAIYSNETNDFFADVVLTNGRAVIQDQNISTLIYPLGTNYTRKVKDITDSSDTTFIFNRTTDGASIASGIISVSVGTAGEEIAYSSGSLSTDEKREIFLTLTGSASVSLTGTVSGTTGTNTISGSATTFTNLSVGDRLNIDGNDYFIANITNDTNLTLTTNLLTTPSGVSYTKQFLSGDIIDLTTTGSSGSLRTATVSSGSLTINIQDNISVGAKITYRVSRSSSNEIRKLLRSNRYVKITCSSLSSLTDPINLGIPDVYQIRSIRRSTSAFSTDTEGSDVTNQFTFDNGQRDNFYDHAKIRPTGLTLTTSDFLLIKLDHFEPDLSTGVGYFSIDSYPIDDTLESDTTIKTYQIPKYVSSFGTNFDLRNCLDFRPIKVLTATSSNTVSGATVNPLTTDNFYSSAGGFRTPCSDSRITADYSYYLPRRDIVGLDKDGNFVLVKGESAKTPLTPSINDNVMAIASVYITPSPSITETLARQLNDNVESCISRRIASIRHTMRDIGVLKSRIENLEYYNALTLLEKSAVDLKIVDENGLDRFKNGFFVDGFLDHSLGATSSPDYKIAIDKDEGCIRPHFRLDSFKYDWANTSSGSSGVVQTGDLITLPYTEELLIDQPNVTTIRNIEQSVFRYIGTITLNPKNDVWTDVTTVDKTVEFGNQLPIQDTLTTEWNSWETYSVGYNLYDRNYGDRSGVVDPNFYLGTYTSAAAAIAASKWSPYTKNGTMSSTSTDNRALLETVTTEQRTGIVTKVTSEKQTQELGNFVTDVSLNTYIRPQSIRIYVRGLKAGARFYTFFDGEDMSSYVTPMVIPAGGVDLASEYLNEGDAWRADEYGELLGYLRLPVEGRRFTVGTKEITITDSPTNAIDATTYAKTHFLAQGITVQKQNTILSTQIPVIQKEEITEQRTLQTTQVLGPSCMAYSFKVDVDRNQEGVFLTSVDVYIKEKHPTLGIWFEIREMNAAGGVTRTQVPFSEVWYESADVNISSNGYTNPHKVTFPAPVFLYNNTQYAFVIHTEGLNPDYYFWVSRLGETDVQTLKPVTSRALKGTLFTTNNNLNYDMVPDVDLKCTFRRARFTSGSSGLAKFYNRPTEFLNLKSGASAFRRFGENIIGSDILTLSGASGIIVGDVLTGGSSGATGNVISIDGSDYYTDGFGFSITETVSSSGGSGTISSIQSGSGVLTSYNSDYDEVETLTGTVTASAGANTISGAGTNFDILEVNDVIKIDSNYYTVSNVNNSSSIEISENLSTSPASNVVYRTIENYMIVDNSNGKFFDNGAIKGENSLNTGVIRAFDNFKYSSSIVKPHYLNFRNTNISFVKRGYDQAVNNFGTDQPGFPDRTTAFPSERMILSKYNEDNTFGDTSSQLDITMGTNTEFLSPVVDLSKVNAVYIHNLINNDYTEEDGVSGGNLLNRYISKTVTLADGQDAEDLIVKLTAFRPAGSDVKVWMKVRHNEDEQSLEQKSWIELDYNNNLFSSAANLLNYVDIDFTVPDAYKNSSTGVLEYSSGGNTFSGFKQYTIKIGLLGTNSALVPKVADLRIIALQM